MRRQNAITADVTNAARFTTIKAKVALTKLQSVA